MSVTTDYSGDQAAQSGGAIYLEREGEHAIEQVVEAVRTVPWSVTLLQLAWTAGPVTFVAMQGASWLGSGMPAAGQNVRFFVAYTLIAGLVGVVTRVIFKATRARKEAKAQANLRRVIDQLPDLVFSIRDQHLKALDPETRQREAAGLLLRKVEVTPGCIARSVVRLTGNPALGEAAAEIELFRRAGLFSRVEDVIQDYQAQIEQAVNELAGTTPSLAAVLRERMRGNAPTPEEGVPREVNFIERVLAAMDEDRLSLMTLRDAEEMLLLAFELMTGRKIPGLGFVYRGRWRLARLMDEVEEARNRYRLAQATIHNRLRTLHDRLSDEDAAPPDAGRLQTGAADLLVECRDMMNHRVWQLSKGRTSRGNPRDDLRVAVEIAESLDSAYRTARQRYATFLRAQRRWRREVSRHPLRIHSGSPVRERRGIRLLKRCIELDDEAKLALAEVLAGYFDRNQIRTHGQRVMKGRPDAVRPLGEEEIKRLAIQVALALEPHIGLSRSEVQRAVNSTSAIYLSGIEPGTSATMKAAWGTAMGAEIHNDLGTMAERLALTLIQTYKVALDDASVRLLHEQYGANRERLKTMMSTQHTDVDGAITYPGFHPHLEFDKRWKWTLDGARSVLEMGVGRRP